MPSLFDLIWKTTAISASLVLVGLALLWRLAPDANSARAVRMITRGLWFLSLIVVATGLWFLSLIVVATGLILGPTAGAWFVLALPIPYAVTALACTGVYFMIFRKFEKPLRFD